MHSPYDWKEWLMKKTRTLRSAIFFLFPAFIFYVIFMVYPIIQSVQLSFTEWNGYATIAPEWVGIANYKRMLSDPVFIKAFKNTVLYMVINIVVQIPIGLMLALFLSKKRKGQRFFKMAFFMPVILSSTAISLMWKFILSPENGLLNTILTNLGLGEYAHIWLGEPGTVMPAISLVAAWQGMGYVMILLLAAVVNIPDSVIEQSIIDGAGSFTRTIHIVIPLIWGAIKTNVVLLIIGAVKVCDIVYVMTSGGPNHSSEVLASYMYNTSFANGSFGYGSAIATFIFVFGIVLTIITNKLMKKDTIEY